MADITGKTFIPPVKRQPIKRPSLEFLMKENGFDTPGEPGGPPMGTPPKLTPTIYVKDGVVQWDPDSQYALYGGQVRDEGARDVKIVSYDGNIGGIYVENCEYTVENAVIHLSGDGMGLGGKIAGAGVGKHGTLTLRNANISMTGESRCATSAGETSILRVYDSTLTSHGAPYGADAVGGSTMKPPAALEIQGNCRTHCTVQNSYSYFYNSTIITDGWAALSTDMSDGFVYLEANDCQVITTKNGYGAYADTYCHDLFRRCRFDVSAMGVIIAGESDAAFEDCQVNCGSYLALVHCVMGQYVEAGTLKVRGGQVRTGREAILVKSQNFTVEMIGVDIESGNGVLVRSVLNDDPVTTRLNGREAYGIHVKLRDMNVSGDILHQDPEREMTVYLTGTTLRGKLSRTRLLMDRGSKWIATEDSTVELSGGFELEQLDALKGVTIWASGAEGGTYTLASGGQLVVE